MAEGHQKKGQTCACCDHWRAEVARLEEVIARCDEEIANLHAALLGIDGRNDVDR